MGKTIEKFKNERSRQNSSLPVKLICYEITLVIEVKVYTI